VEGSRGIEKPGPTPLWKYNTKEYVKVIRLLKPEYSLEFWQQPALVKEVEQILKSRLQANGDKLAETAPDSAGRPWWRRSFRDGETLSLPGYTGVEIRFRPIFTNSTDPNCLKILYLYAEIA
jgi:hypothetical protein